MKLNWNFISEDEIYSSPAPKSFSLTTDQVRFIISSYNQLDTIYSDIVGRHANKDWKRNYLSKKDHLISGDQIADLEEQVAFLYPVNIKQYHFAMFKDKFVSEGVNFDSVWKLVFVFNIILNKVMSLRYYLDTDCNLNASSESMSITHIMAEDDEVLELYNLMNKEKSGSQLLDIFRYDNIPAWELVTEYIKRVW